MSEVKTSSSGTRKCYHCGKPGHQAKDCPQAPAAGGDKKPAAAAAAPAVKAEPAAASSASASAAAPSASSGTRKCYSCGQTGHPAKDCPQAAKDGGKSAAASAASTKKPAAEKESTFKERLEEYKQKAAGQEGQKKNFCYLCGKEGHRERDCPKNSKKKEDKTCLKCGEPDHIARYCPTIANRTVYRQENKERAKGCYICGEEGHHAEECKELEALAEEFPKFQSKLQSGMKLNVKVWAVMLEKCAKALELNGALYLYEEMLTKGIEPNADVMKHLEYIYDRSGKDHSKLDGIPMRKKRVQRLKEIVQAHRFEAKKEQATDSIVTHLVHFLKSNGSARAAAEHQSSLFDLAKHLKKISESTQIPGLNEPLSSATARLALTTLKSLGRYHQKSKACEFDLDGEDVNQPGKFVKKEAPKEGEKAETKTSKKKKKVKASKKKKEKAAAAAAAAGSTDADGDVDMKSDEKSSSKKDKKRKAEDAASSKQENGAKKSKPSASTKKPAAATATAAPAVKAEKKRKAAPVEEDDAPATEKEEKKSSTTKKAAKKVKA